MNGLVRGRLRALAAVLLLWGAVVTARLVQLQIAQGGKYRARAERQQQKRVDVAPRRGSILDRDGRELAVSVEAATVYAAPDEIENRSLAAQTLARLTGAPEAAIAARLGSSRSFVAVVPKIEMAQAAAVREAKIPGIHLVPDSKRFYPRGEIAAAVLGFVGTENHGLEGLEYFYDRVVGGKPGEYVLLTDARRSTYGEAETGSGRPPQEGASLVLSLDSGIQFAAEKELSAAVAESHARSGSIVVLDPFNGEILAMATAPGFDPRAFNRYPAEVRRNRAVADAYEPGSTFKIVTGGLALENRLVTPDEIIETGDGTIRIGSVTISESGNRQYGAMTLAGVFEHSSNVGIIRVGLRLGPERLYAGASAFGVGRDTGVDLPGENAGIFRPLPRWSFLSNAEISMGQEVALTALQLARIAAVVANGGLLVRPHLVTRVVEPDGSVRPPAAADAPRVLSEATARTLSDILVGVVARGTGTRGAIPGFTVAGKTGTAQKAGVGGYQPGRYVANFVGFAPAEKPRLVAVVVIEEPQGQYYANEVAAPVFAKVVAQALGILRVAPREQAVPATLVAASLLSLRYGDGVVPAGLPVSGPPRRLASFEPGRTPHALGLSAREALALFGRLGIPVRLEGAGFVVSQDPPAGAAIASRPLHVLTLSQAGPAAARPSRGREEPPSPPVP
ncbi:MAG: penicillin-binding transpeptidase domain-containing protein [Thermoanaerobaculia bacterium]